MSDGINIDSSELRALAADLTAAGSGIASKVRPVVHRGANNIKRQMREEMNASRHFNSVAHTIDYSMGGGMVFGVGVIEAEIGPSADPGSPGNLANIAYFGSSRGGGTVPDPTGAAEAEMPRFEQALSDVLDGLL